MTISAVAKVLVVNDNGEVLFLRRSQTDTRRPGQWDLPGGAVETGEDLKAAAIRETQEEAGLELQDPVLIYGYSEPRSPYGLPTWVFFAEKIKQPADVVLSFEHDAFKWMKPEIARQEITYKLHQRLLKYVIENKLLESLTS